MDRKPLVIVDGRIRQLSPGDTIAGGVVSPIWKEPVAVLNGGNPEIVFTSTGDTVMNDASQ